MTNHKSNYKQNERIKVHHSNLSFERDSAPAGAESLNFTLGFTKQWGRLVKYVIIFCLLTFSGQLYSGEIAHDEEALKKRAYEFMTEGWGGEKIRGYSATHNVKEFFHRVGKVKKESIQLIKRKDNSSANDELHNYQYDGMTVSVYVARMGREEKIMVDDVVITSPSWPVKYGLIVGVSRKQIEESLGKSMGIGSPSEWNYGDGLSEVTYFFDNDDKVISIKWHSTID